MKAPLSAARAGLPPDIREAIRNAVRAPIGRAFGLPFGLPFGFQRARVSFAPSMIETLLIAAAGLYAAEYTLMYVGGRRMAKARRAVPVRYPMITVLVAARNEEANIERCLNALIAQDYPAASMQIVAVNDDSADTTLAIMERMAAEHPGRITIACTVEEATHARGKARAIAQGMDVAVGEIVLLTDADCAPPPTWARAVTEYFIPGIDVVGGFTLVQGDTLFAAVQQVEWIHLQTLGSSAIALGAPVGVIGNNFSFRRSAYDAVGGYRAVPFTVTEDFALYRAMIERGHRAVFPCDPDALMVTLPCPTLGDVMRQKQRWARGGTENTIPGYTLFVVALVIIVAFSAAPFVSAKAWIIVWAVKIICDLVIIGASYRRLKMPGQIRFVLPFQFYFVVQLFMIPILLMNKTVVWKGREYR